MTIPAVKFMWIWIFMTVFICVPNIISQHICRCFDPFNTLRPRQKGRHFADDIFKCIFLNENAWISLKISLQFVPKVRINNIPALVQIMAWRRPGASHYLNQWRIIYWRIYASLGLNGLSHWHLEPSVFRLKPSAARTVNVPANSVLGWPVFH